MRALTGESSSDVGCNAEETSPSGESSDKDPSSLSGKDGHTCPLAKYVLAIDSDSPNKTNNALHSSILVA